MKTPKAIIFDYHNTILHETSFTPSYGTHYLFSCAKNNNGITYEEFIKRIRGQNSDLFQRRDSSYLEYPFIHSFRLLFEYFQLELPYSFQEAERKFWELSEHLQPAHSVSEMLEYLNTKNITAGIVSNSTFSGELLEAELEKYGLRKYFKFLIASADYGIRKPHPFIFELAISKMGSPVEDIWSIGDNIECDIKGSQNVGMTAFHYIGKSKKRELTEEQTIKSWEDFIKSIQNTHTKNTVNLNVNATS